MRRYGRSTASRCQSGFQGYEIHRFWPGPGSFCAKAHCQSQVAPPCQGHILDWPVVRGCRQGQGSRRSCMFEFVFQFKFFSHPSPSEDQLGDLAEVAAHLRRNPSLAAYGLVCHRSAEWLRDRRALFGGILRCRNVGGRPRSRWEEGVLAAEDWLTQHLTRRRKSVSSIF